MLDESYDKLGKEKWAVLVGVNFYMPGDARLDEGGDILRYPSLRGCVRDITQVEQYFLQALGVKESRILKLTATKPDDREPKEPKEEKINWPTYENIVRVLGTVTQEAKPGDFVYIHYSGHGARAKTLYQALKGENGYDEAIVPTDIGCGGRYLRDVEIASLLDKMVKKKLIVTVVLDSCYSGSATRGPGGPVARGIGKVDGLVLPSDKSDISLEELDSTKGHYGYRSGRMKQNWLLEPHGYELLTACRPHEKANEDLFENEWRGALTYWLMDALQSGGTYVTHSMLHRRIYEKIQNDFSQQTPILGGNGERLFFGSDIVRNAHAIAVKRPKSADQTSIVELQAGKAHGVCGGSEYAVYRWNTSDFADPKACIAKINITEVSQLTSKAQIVEDLIPSWPHGCQAVLLKKPIEAQTRVKLLYQAGIKGIHKDMLDRIRQMDWEVYLNGVAPLSLISDNDKEPASYNLTVNDYGRYELWDAACKPLPNLTPSSNPEVLLSNIAHLSQFRIIRDLKNFTSALRDKFEFQIVYQRKGSVPASPTM